MAGESFDPYLGGDTDVCIADEPIKPSAEIIYLDELQKVRKLEEQIQAFCDIFEGGFSFEGINFGAELMMDMKSDDNSDIEYYYKARTIILKPLSFYSRIGELDMIQLGDDERRNFIATFNTCIKKGIETGGLTQEILQTSWNTYRTQVLLGLEYFPFASTIVEEKLLEVLSGKPKEEKKDISCNWVLQNYQVTHEIIQNLMKISVDRIFSHRTEGGILKYEGVSRTLRREGKGLNDNLRPERETLHSFDSYFDVSQNAPQLLKV